MKGVLERIRKLRFNFLWFGDKEKCFMAWVKWKQIVIPKDYGGPRLKNIHQFVKALVVKSGWMRIKGVGLWIQVVIQKYVALNSLKKWESC
jgi:hypothetical protein